MNLGKPRATYDDFKGQPIEARLLDGSTITGTILELWMTPDGEPLMLRIGSTDVPYRSVVSMTAMPALSDGWHGPVTPAELNDVAIGADLWYWQGHTWWREAVTRA